jgi:hypothetical protein
LQLNLSDCKFADTDGSGSGFKSGQPDNWATNNPDCNGKSVVQNDCGRGDAICRISHGNFFDNTVKLIEAIVFVRSADLKLEFCIIGGTIRRNNRFILKDCFFPSEITRRDGFADLASCSMDLDVMSRHLMQFGTRFLPATIATPVLCRPLQQLRLQRAQVNAVCDTGRGMLRSQQELPPNDHSLFQKLLFDSSFPISRWSHFAYCGNVAVCHESFSGKLSLKTFSSSSCKRITQERKTLLLWRAPFSPLLLAKRRPCIKRALTCFRS